MMPTCFVIGAPRSGTTSIYEYLNAHPDIYMSPVKEPDFFSRASMDAVYGSIPCSGTAPDEDAHHNEEFQADLEGYLHLFDGRDSQKICGEASAVYLGHPTAAMHLRRFVPDARLIVILRDPAERFHSHYVHAARIRSDAGATEESNRQLAGEVTATIDCAYRHGFAGTATTEPEVWLLVGFYYQHLTRLLSLFPENQVRIFLFEDLVCDPRTLMAEIFRFLAVDSTFTLPTTAAFNASVVPRNQGMFGFFTTQNPLMRFARSLAPTRLRAAAMQTRNRVLNSGKPALEPELRRKLVRIYQQDIQQLQGLLGRDLSAWLAETGDG